jgi:hypothetical protein
VGSQPDTAAPTRLLLVAVAAGAVVLVALFLGLRGGGQEVDARARALADSACELTSGAEEAGRVDTEARLAAAMLLLDKAIVDSTRAAGTDPAFDELDRAVQEVHAAAHDGDPEQYDTAMDAALTECSTSLEET